MIWFESGDLEFAAVELQPETGPARGAVILLHGRGFHADWPETINPLRTALSEQGWHTLSLQMPVLAKDAKYFDYLPVLPEAFPRIEAAIDHLTQRKLHPVVLAAHSCGTHMALAWFEETGDGRIDAFIGIGMGAVYLYLLGLGTSRLGATKVSLFTFIVPVLVAVESILFLDATLHLYQAVGGVLVLAGVFCVAHFRSPSPTAAATSS